jgi:hypothetical protein
MKISMLFFILFMIITSCVFAALVIHSVMCIIKLIDGEYASKKEFWDSLNIVKQIYQKYNEL